jgi:protein involved in polysaccharide export with SLBB domain
MGPYLLNIETFMNSHRPILESAIATLETIGIRHVIQHARVRPALTTFLLSLTVLLLASFGATSPAASEEYRLGPQDKVRLKVHEWRASRDEVFEWTALNDKFSVGANGMLSLPLLGEIPAEGLSPGELANSISELLRTKMALGRMPVTSIEIVEFRPFYIIGYVERPGHYPYRPALTVLQAFSIAGGPRRLSDANLLRLGRETISSQGDLSVLRTQAYTLLARKARLQAEIDRAETISFPEELRQRYGDALIDLIIRQEQQIFKASQEAFTTQMRALSELKSHLEKEIASLNGQLETEDTQIKLVKKELQNISSLVAKGLSVAPRQLALERLQAQIEGDRLRVGTALLKAKQEISRTDISILELHNKRANTASLQLRETQAMLDEATRKMATAKSLISETGATAVQALSLREHQQTAQPAYTIVRQSPDGIAEFKATEATRVMPGDTIKVEIPSSLDPGLVSGLPPGQASEIQ